MFWLIFGIICFIALLWWRLKQNHGWNYLTYVESLLGFMGSVALSLILFLTTSLICSEVAEIKYSLIESKEIVALNDNSGASGQFFLGSGNADHSMKYYFIEATNKGGHMDSVDASKTFIIESNKENPRIEYYRPKWESVVLRWFAHPLNKTRYKIYIPENSMTSNFNIDLE